MVGDRPRGALGLPPSNPSETRPAAATAAARDKSAQIERESAALRANLRKRKQQVQARAAAREMTALPSDPEPPET